MKTTIIIAVLLGMVHCGYAQTLLIKDKRSDEPLEMVMISSQNPPAQIFTNRKGEAKLELFTQSNAIEIRSIGYQTTIYSYKELEESGFEIALEETNVKLDEVIVSAMRWQQNTRNIPAHIVTISAKEVELQNPQTAADLLGSSSEVYIQKSQQGGGSPMIRGFSTNRLLYSVDGIRMNTAIYRSGNIQNVISLDPFAIESTEVLFGPGSIIYGSDAIGGVMSFRTLNPKLQYNGTPLVFGSAVARHSTVNNEFTSHFDFNVGWEKWAMVTSVTHSKFGDLKMGQYGPDEYLRQFYVTRMDSIDRIVANPDPLVQTPTGYSQINMMQKVRYRPNSIVDIEYGFHFSETSEYSRYDRLIETKNGVPRSAVWNYGPQKWIMNNLTVNIEAQNPLFENATIRLASQFMEESRIDRNFSGGNRFRLRTQLENVWAHSANIDFHKTINQHEFFYGLEYIHNDVKSEGSAIDIRNQAPINVADRYPASTWQSYAGYANYQFIISEKATLQSGIRYSRFSVESDFTRHLSFYPFDFTNSNIDNGSTNGSIGFVYKPTSTWQISILGGTGFRAPNVDDMGKIFDFGNAEIVVPNSTLKAEYAYNGEINISKIIGDFMKIDIVGFYTYLDGAMVRRPFQVNGADSILYDGEMSGVYAIQNAAHATVYGANIGVEIKLPYGFAISSRYNYQVGNEEMENGDMTPSRHAAPAFGTTRITLNKKKISLQMYANYCAEVSYANLNEEERQKPVIYAIDSNGKPYSPGWVTLNFKARYQCTSQLSISAGLENITDQRYRPYSSGIVAGGRNFILSIRAKF
ncbi:MAG: TonB-dependent receptor [Salinivirgaceae bacterium]|nr:TonB-dependent receptor [Salinivirgaceae bacterium]